MDASPDDFEPEEGGVRRPGDDDFWAGLHEAVVQGNAALLEEIYLQNASRWHRLTGDTIETVRAGLAPRGRLAVWPDLSRPTGPWATWTDEHSRPAKGFGLVASLDD
ncbi:hypothetical protein [Streptomyces chartreusis]|uniref:hypothetical protein n=1 Tax=Streptomyces chartreusis TaxID=1969 RepID=UPI00167768E6|nr:hypothetical protein [Streptomyces chartreusis]GGX30301.1 hypothetical protein GCM10010321_51420 [Streptomyces chartreusis]